MYKRIILIFWATFLFLSTNGQEMTVYVISPNVPMNWKSPQALLVSYVNNILARNKYVKRRHPMGHLIVELKDTGSYSLIGIVAESKSDLAYKVSVKGYGLGILVTRLAGQMQEEADNRKEVEKRCEKGDITFLKFKINRATFTKLKQYLAEYKERGYDKIYNGENKPREGKGAGCSAFGVSFIELAGLMQKHELSTWQVQVQIPENLVGGPEANNRWVGLHKILLKRKWADTTRQRYRTITYYDPALINNWILSEWDHTGKIEHPHYTRELKGKAKGLVIDAATQTVPDNPIWISKKVVARKEN